MYYVQYTAVGGTYWYDETVGELRSGFKDLPSLLRAFVQADLDVDSYNYRIVKREKVMVEQMKEIVL